MFFKIGVLENFAKFTGKHLRQSLFFNIVAALRYVHTCLYRSSRSQLFYKIGIFKNFAKFSEQYLSRSHFFHEVAELRPATLSKKRLRHTCFLRIFQIFRLSFYMYTEHLQWLLLLVIDVCSLKTILGTGIMIMFTFIFVDYYIFKVMLSRNVLFSE